MVVLNVLTGAAVRLSDSGLGCPDWPTCSQHRLTPPLRLHPLVEFGNRVVVFLLVVACAVTMVASFLRRPARRDLRWLSGGLVLGRRRRGGARRVRRLHQAQRLRGPDPLHGGHGPAGRGGGPHPRSRSRARTGHGGGGRVPPCGSSRALVGMTVLVLAAGAATTGTGPHAGGKGAKRIPLGLEDMTRIHAEVVLATAVLLVAVLWVLWKSDAPARTQNAGRVVLGGDGRAGDGRLHPVLHPSSARAGGPPRARGLDGVGGRALVPPRVVRPPTRGGRAPLEPVGPDRHRPPDAARGREPWNRPAERSLPEPV